MSKTNSESRRFTMHSKLLFDVISRQAGALSKALLEAVMNSADAGAKACEVTLTKSDVRIVDDGRGITDQKQVESHFESFGHPHSDEEAKKFGTFRMGRGQLFAYGVNLWRTGPFEMVVDFKRKGIDYTLVKNKEVVKGCDIRIGLYEEMTNQTLRDTEDELTEHVKYLGGIDVVLNGKKINTKLESTKWTHETEEAYILLNDSRELNLYNLGVHTVNLGAHKFGSGGVVVTKKQIKVNFARTEVIRDCPVWREIEPFLRKAAVKQIRKEKMTDDQRIAVLRNLGRGVEADDVRALPLFRNLSGRPISADKIVRELHVCNGLLTFCKEGDARADRIHQSQMALPLSTWNLDQTAWTAEEFLQWVNRDKYGRLDFKLGDFSKLAKELTGRFLVLTPDELTATEQVWLDVAKTAGRQVLWDLAAREARACGGQFRHYYREVDFVIGESDVADGWTDGKSYVVIGRRFLSNLQMDLGGFVELGALALHELCHHESSAGSHLHDEHFYREFHDLVAKSMPKFIQDCIRTVPTALETVGRRETKKMLKERDRREKVEKAVAKSREHPAFATAARAS